MIHIGIGTPITERPSHSTGHTDRVSGGSADQSRYALVSFYAPEGNPINRPYFNNEPTFKMPSVYDDYSGDFSVYLWQSGKGFSLDLRYEETYALDQFQREALIPALTRFEDDSFLDQYYDLFGNLNHFTKIFNVK
jgi:hypothetical protein